MRAHNTMGEGAYVLLNVVWMVMAMAAYRSVCFRLIAGLGFTQSKILLWLIAIICVTAGLVLTLRKRRTMLNIIATLAIPFGIYSLLSCGALLKGTVRIIGYICLILLMLYFTLVMWGVSTCHKFLKRLLFFSLGARVIVAFALLTVVAIIYISSLFSAPLLYSSEQAIIPTESTEEWTVEDHIEQLHILGDTESWLEASVEERLNALQTVANIEVGRLGIGHELYVGVDLLKENTVGSYIEKNDLIVIDAVHIRDELPLEVLDTLCHEAYHAYEHRLADLYTAIPTEYRELGAVSRFGKYYEEFNDYTNGEEGGFYNYYTQSVEADARKYAEAASRDYIYEIRYLTGAD